MPPRRQRAEKNKSLLVQQLNDSSPSSDSMQQFELELQWCIQQLEGALSTNKMTSKQVQQAVQSLNILQSKNAPVIKKRQFMRSSFGDYRIKMAAEEKKLNKAQVKVHISASSPNKKSRFLKQSSVSLHDKTCNELLQNSFRLNSAVPGNEKANCSQEDTNHNSFSYKNSDNSFRFHFKQPST